MKNKDFIFGAILTFSVLFVGMCFVYANRMRDIPSMGGEVFTIALPLWIVWKKLTTMGQKIEKLKQYNKALEKAM